MNHKYHIVRAPDGGPVRDAVRSAPGKHTGYFWSFKTCRRHPFEAFDEVYLLTLLEADGSIRSFLSQPFTLRIPAQPRPLRAIPDAEAIAFDGSHIVYEAREAKEPRDDVDAAKRRSLVQACDMLGWRFELEVRPDLERQPRLDAAISVAADGGSVVADDELKRVRMIAGSQAGSTYGEIVDALGGGPRAAAKLHACVVRHGIHIDLDGGLIPNAAVRSCVQP